MLVCGIDSGEIGNEKGEPTERAGEKAEESMLIIGSFMAVFNGGRWVIVEGGSNAK